MATRSLPAPDYARNMRLLGHSDQGGRPDGVQVMVHRGYADYNAGLYIMEYGG